MFRLSLRQGVSQWWYRSLKLFFIPNLQPNISTFYAHHVTPYTLNKLLISIQPCPENTTHMFLQRDVQQQKNKNRKAHFLARYTGLVIEEFNTCLKRSRFVVKIKDLTLISNACHQNTEGKIVIFVSSFSFSRKIRDYSSYELIKLFISPLIQVFIVYCLYCEKTMLFLISWGDFKATCCAVVDKLCVTAAVHASHKATSTRAFKNNIMMRNSSL